MIIVSAADENFVPHFAAMLHSAWLHNPEAVFYLLDCGITSNSRETLKRFAGQKGIALQILSFDKNEISTLPTARNWTLATFARLLIPQLLSAEVDKAIYIDADCIVTDALSGMWDIDISNCLLAAVRDDIARSSEKRASGIDQPDYFNAGVMLMNLLAWRNEKFGDQVIAYIREKAPVFLDQSAINVLATGRVAILHEKWNLIPHSITEKRLSFTPHIIHFTTKPWLNTRTAFSRIYFFHRNMTPFKFQARNSRRNISLRFMINLIILRPKYWRRLICPLINERYFTTPYLERKSASPRI